MHYTRISAFLLGALLLGGLFLAFAATRNFRAVDAVLHSPPPEASKMVQTLGPQNARQLLRYLAGEENRSYFEIWEFAQLLLGALLTGFLLFGVENRLLASLAGAMFILTLFQHFKITPEILWMGRSIDFLPNSAESQVRDQFWKLHGIYSGIEVVKMLLAVLVAGFLFPLRRRRVQRRVEADAVDHARHRSVNW